MNEFSFEWMGKRRLREELQSSFIKASIPEVRHNVAFGLNLWRADGTAVAISSKMHDLDDLEEVGVLSFDIRLSPNNDQIVIDLPEHFSKVLTVKKLIVTETETIHAESGICLEMEGGHSLTVVAGSFPCSVAIDGLPNIANLFNPEWPMEKYVKEELG